jgi:hypothetical protein
VAEEGSEIKKFGSVVDPDWTGRIKVILDDSEETRICTQEELELLKKNSADGGGETGWKAGDRVTVVKESARRGQGGVIVDPAWEGQIKVALDGVEGFESYLASELTNLTQSAPEAAGTKASAALGAVGAAVGAAGAAVGAAVGAAGAAVGAAVEAADLKISPLKKMFVSEKERKVAHLKEMFVSETEKVMKVGDARVDRGMVLKALQQFCREGLGGSAAMYTALAGAVEKAPGKGKSGKKNSSRAAVQPQQHPSAGPSNDRRDSAASSAKVLEDLADSIIYALSAGDNNDDPEAIVDALFDETDHKPDFTKITDDYFKSNVMKSMQKTNAFQRRMFDRLRSLGPPSEQTKAYSTGRSLRPVLAPQPSPFPAGAPASEVYMQAQLDLLSQQHEEIKKENRETKETLQQLLEKLGDMHALMQKKGAVPVGTEKGAVPVGTEEALGR